MWEREVGVAVAGGYGWCGWLWRYNKNLWLLVVGVMAVVKVANVW